MRRTMSIVCVAGAVAMALAGAASGGEHGLTYEGKDGPGKGRKIVILAADEEYRSEEGMPMLAKILAERHGFTCRVLFAIHPDTGEIDPGTRDNIPGLEALEDADLMVVFIRWRDLPDDQARRIIAYAESGRPMMSLRTGTHPFKFDTHKTYLKYTWDYTGPEYAGGFGRQVFGETWHTHHGAHGREGTRGLIAPGMAGHPILRGIRDGDIFGDTDVYGVRLPLPGDSRPLILGQVVAGLTPEAPPVEGKKNDPMMPVAWIKTYEGDSGRPARIFTTTMGAATDLRSEGLRRLVVNAAYWTLGLEDKIPEKSDVDYIGDYHPTPSQFGGHKKGVKPRDLD